MGLTDYLTGNNPEDKPDDKPVSAVQTASTAGPSPLLPELNTGADSGPQLPARIEVTPEEFARMQADMTALRDQLAEQQRQATAHLVPVAPEPPRTIDEIQADIDKKVELSRLNSLSLDALLVERDRANKIQNF